MVQTIYMMRHGQTLFNQRGKIQGASDSPLTSIGIRQAEIARDHFKDMGIVFESGYASTQERASDTLEIVTDYQLDYRRLKGLKEWNFGTFEAESEDLNPPLPYDDFFVTYGGESQADVQKRVHETMHQIMLTETADHILIVSHGAAIINFMRMVVPESEWKYGRELGFTNCSSLVFHYEDGKFNYIDVINHDYSQIL